MLSKCHMMFNQNALLPDNIENEQLISSHNKIRVLMNSDLVHTANLSRLNPKCKHRTQNKCLVLYVRHCVQNDF